MYRALPYFLLFAVTMLLQVFLFDNLSISVYLNPLVYVAFIALLPLGTPPIVMLGAGLVTGVVMDCAMGTAGINTISTLLIAFLRPTIVNLLSAHEDARDGGIPSPERFGRRKFQNYLIVLVLLHQIVFFSLESLSWMHVVHTLLRILISSTVTVAFVWIIARIFTAKLITRS